MKVKHLLFLAPFLGAATFLAFCSKEKAQNPAQPVVSTTEATDRGPNCNFTITSTQPASMCGNSLGSGSCSDCGNAGTGYSVITDGGIPFGSSFPDGHFSVTNLYSGINDIRVYSNGVLIAFKKLQPGECATATYTAPCTYNF